MSDRALGNSSDYKCQTKEDARRRVLISKIGSLAGATIPYLEEMERLLYYWLEQIKEKRHELIAQAQRQQENETESYRTSEDNAGD